ncbi:hypothetical protein [Lysinibacillus sp. SGAir0095]|uniref:hypothetical protein n=1 Tax=Lysinibacillus sp. SGAir0095 TaxID=2070463 RepID=UPI0010CD3F8D|nr:hypothetical protein [Lysinibacillus sp. SGAir0095]QCR32595.1 hypothetical protein C1N55_10625 [Lysinibacillus sp. SGAir0095]
MTKDINAQYNGMILLTGYLQRLFVAETIYRRIGEPYDQERFDKAKALLDETYTIMPVFEETKSLTPAQKIQLQLIAQQTDELMQTYFKQMPLTFKQKLAIVGSSLYAEQHVNSGIIRLGKMFNVEVNKDFHQRIKFYEQRTKMIDYLVFAFHHNEEVEEQFMKPIDPWFNDVMRNKDFVLDDFKQIAQLLEF